MKVGVIGTGYWGRKHVAEFHGLGVEVIAADLDKKKLEEFKKKKIATTLNYKEILNDPEVKAVTICAPNKHHFPLAKECLKAGKHVLVEKPIAEIEKQAEELIQLAKEKMLILMTGHVYRFNNAIDKVKEMMQKGEFGTVRQVKVQWVNDEYAFQPDFDQRVGDRDVITDLAVHPYDILHYLFGKSPEFIFCVGKSFKIPNKVEATTILGELDKMMVSVEISWITPPKTRLLSVVGEKKSVFVHCATQKIEVVENDQRKEVHVTPNNTIQTELAYFLKLVENNKEENKASGEIGKEILRMLTLTKNSIENREVVVTR